MIKHLQTPTIESHPKTNYFVIFQYSICEFILFQKYENHKKYYFEYVNDRQLTCEFLLNASIKNDVLTYDYITFVGRFF